MLTHRRFRSHQKRAVFTAWSVSKNWSVRELFLIVVVVVLVLAVNSLPVEAAAASSGNVAGSAAQHPAGAAPEPKSVIVVFDQSTDRAVIDRAIKEVQANGGSVNHIYEHSIRGFSAFLKPESAVSVQQSVLAKFPQIEYIEEDSVVTTQ